ncbi:hypothetical protein BDK51DRAFT_28326, partial [Blyttiomyces helicus]
IFDTIGIPPIYHACAAYLKPEKPYVNIGADTFKVPSDIPGMIVSVVVNKLPAWLGGVPREFRSETMFPKKESLIALGKLCEEDKVTGNVDSVFAFDDVQQAYERILSSRARGKVVVTVA